MSSHHQTPTQPPSRPADYFFQRNNACLALSQQACTLCFGFGRRLAGHKSTSVPCSCVLRTIFRRCLEKFRQCSVEDPKISRSRSEMSLPLQNGKNCSGANHFGMPSEEFMADFTLIAHRVLNNGLSRSDMAEQDIPETLDYKLFKFHYLLGAEWKPCCEKLGLDRGNFYHRTYKIEEALGYAFATLTPFPLFPCDEYFSRGQAKSIAATIPVKRARRVRIKPPLETLQIAA